MLLKHPVSEKIVDVTGARATVLKARGYTQVDGYPSATAPPAVQPQPPIDARPNPPEPAVDARPAELVNEPVIDTRPPNPLGPTAESVEDADGAGLDDEDADEAADGDDQGTDGETVEAPARNASHAAWIEYAKARGVDDADSLSRAELIDLLA